MFGRRFKFDDPIKQMITKSLMEGGSAAGQSAWHIFFPWIKSVCQYLGIGDINRVHKIQKEMKDYIWFVHF